jgi:hypothetical protein
MEKIPSVLEYFKGDISKSTDEWIEGFIFCDPDKIIEFAKLHVQAQQEAIIKNIELEDITQPNCDDHTPYWGACVTCGRIDNPDIIIGAKVKEESILNAYPLTNII